MEKTGFLEEAPHVKSSTRLGFLSGVYSILAMAGYMVYKHYGSPLEIGTFLTMSFSALVGLKYFGTKNEPTITADATPVIKP